MKAKTLAIISQKGGVSKSTLAVNLAVLASDAGLRVALIDLDDVQRTASSWLEGRASSGIGKPITVFRASAIDIPSVLARASATHDLIVFDTKAAADAPSAAAVHHADLVLMPTRPDSLFDLDAVGATIQMTRQEQRRSAIVFSLVNPRRMEIAGETRQGLESSGVTVCPAQIADRASVKDAISFGLAVHEHAPKDRGAKEMIALAHWVGAELDLQMVPVITKPKKVAA